MQAAPRPKCGRKARTTGEPCKNNKVNGADVCRMHGGTAPQVLAAAAVRLVEADARAAVGKLQLRTGAVDNPLRALQEVAGELIDVKDWLRAHVQSLTEMRSTDDKGAEQVRAELQAYMGMLTATVNALAQLGKLRIDERLAAINEEQKRMIIEAMRAGFASAGVLGAAQTTAMGVVARQLRVIQGGAAA